MDQLLHNCEANPGVPARWPRPRPSSSQAGAPISLDCGDTAKETDPSSPSQFLPQTGIFLRCNYCVNYHCRLSSLPQAPQVICCPPLRPHKCTVLPGRISGTQLRTTPSRRFTTNASSIEFLTEIWWDHLVWSQRLGFSISLDHGDTATTGT